MRIVYPLLWSELSREAGREQTLNTVSALAREGCEVTLLAPRRPADPVLRADEVAAYFDVPATFAWVQRDWRWVSPQALPSVLWLRRALRDPLVGEGEVLLSRIPAMLAGGWASPIPFATDHYRPWPDDLPVLRPLIRRTARAPLCLGTILHSDFAAESYRRCGVSDEQLLVAHNGADLRRFEPRLTTAEARRALGLPVDRPTVVYAGRINRTKGLEQVLALADLRPEVAFVLVGSRRRRTDRGRRAQPPQRLRSPLAGASRPAGMALRRRRADRSALARAARPVRQLRAAAQAVRLPRCRPSDPRAACARHRRFAARR